MEKIHIALIEMYLGPFKVSMMELFTKIGRLFRCKTQLLISDWILNAPWKVILPQLKPLA